MQRHFEKYQSAALDSTSYQVVFAAISSFRSRVVAEFECPGVVQRMMSSSPVRSPVRLHVSRIDEIADRLSTYVAGLLEGLRVARKVDEQFPVRWMVDAHVDATLEPLKPSSEHRAHFRLGSNECSCLTQLRNHGYTCEITAPGKVNIVALGIELLAILADDANRQELAVEEVGELGVEEQAHMTQYFPMEKQ